MDLAGFFRGDSSLTEAADEQFLLCLQLGGGLISVPGGIGQGFAVDQLIDFGDVVDRHDRHQAAAAHLKKAVSQSLLQPVEGGPCLAAPYRRLKSSWKVRQNYRYRF